MTLGDDSTPEGHASACWFDWSQHYPVRAAESPGSAHALEIHAQSEAAK
jgi:hypothetical protein